MNFIHLGMKFPLRIDHKCSIVVLHFAIGILLPGDAANCIHLILQTLLLDNLQGLGLIKILSKLDHKIFSVGGVTNLPQY